MKAELNGVDLYYEVQGSGERMVLTHGAWSDASTWQAVVNPLSQRFEVVAWDRRGHSRSGESDTSDTWVEDLEDLAALIEHLGGQPVHLVGNSAGGSVVLNLMARRPDLVASALVHEPAAFGLLDMENDGQIAREIEANLNELDTVIRLIESGHHRQAAEQFIGVALGEGAWDALPEAVHESMAANAPTFLGELRPPFDPTAIDVAGLTRETVPLLVTAGTDSPLMERAAAERLAELIPSARLEVLSGTGHVPQRTHPELWVETVEKFVSSLDDRTVAAG